MRGGRRWPVFSGFAKTFVLNFAPVGTPKNCIKFVFEQAAELAHEVITQRIQRTFTCTFNPFRGPDEPPYKDLGYSCYCSTRGCSPRQFQAAAEERLEWPGSSVVIAAMRGLCLACSYAAQKIVLRTLTIEDVATSQSVALLALEDQIRVLHRNLEEFKREVGLLPATKRSRHEPSTDTLERQRIEHLLQVHFQITESDIVFEDRLTVSAVNEKLAEILKKPDDELGSAAVRKASQLLDEMGAGKHNSAGWKYKRLELRQHGNGQHQSSSWLGGELDI